MVIYPNISSSFIGNSFSRVLASPFKVRGKPAVRRCFVNVNLSNVVSVATARVIKLLPGTCVQTSIRSRTHVNNPLGRTTFLHFCMFGKFVLRTIIIRNILVCTLKLSFSSAALRRSCIIDTSVPNWGQAANPLVERCQQAP